MSFRGAGDTRTRTPKGHSVTIIKTLAIVALTLVGLSAQASQSFSDADAERAYQEAMQARMDGVPHIAEAILQSLVSARPNDAQYRFDLGVAQAEQQRCAQASRTFSSAGQMAQLPSFQQAVAQAMADLCPGLAPLEWSLGTELRYDTNANGGAGDATIDVFGIPMTLSEDAVARRSVGYRVSGSAAYNFRLDDLLYVVPGVSVSVLDMTGESLDEATIAPSVSLRYVGDRMDVRVGPTALLIFDHGGLTKKGFGVSTALSYSLSALDGIYFNASANDVEDLRNPLQDYRQKSASVRYLRAFSEKKLLGRVELGYNDSNYTDDFQDLSSWRLEFGVQGPITDKVGYDLSISHTINDGDAFNPAFESKRHDDVTSVSANVSLAQFDGWYGRPYVGLTYTVSDSTFPTKDFDRALVNFGFTKRF